jgi:hypothetical protein
VSDLRLEIIMYEHPLYRYLDYSINVIIRFPYYFDGFPASLGGILETSALKLGRIINHQILLSMRCNIPLCSVAGMRVKKIERGS